MARGKQTDLAVLGALSVRPMSGYAVREAIREVLGHFWSESYGQIYPALAQLQRDGLIEAGEGSRAGSSVFTLTRQGRKRLKELLAEPYQTVPPRNGLLLRLFFGHSLGDEACRELLRQAKADAQAQLATFTAIRAEMEADGEDGAHQRYILLTVSAGEHSARATIAWADESLAALG